MKIDPADLVDANDVAAMLGLTFRQAVSTYRHRYADFPTPVVDRGKCVFWLRQDIERWDAARKRRRADDTRHA